MRYIAITDIHGELKKLESVLSQIDTRPDDVFVFMGDYIDRGPDSRGVVDRIIALGETNKCIYLIGSHEYALLHTNDEYYQFLFDNYGGMKSIWFISEESLFIQNTSFRKKLFSGIQSLMNHILMKAKFVLIWDAESIRMHIYVH